MIMNCFENELLCLLSSFAYFATKSPIFLHLTTNMNIAYLNLAVKNTLGLSFLLPHFPAKPHPHADSHSQ